ncbi:hypothetical protein CXG81DRAFT_20333 [Caulochytrium protostelioides]|uniref:P-loop containing nucleoside triphosphate hydrolase protein n=1 Tax=Caulochytrium protostelioides TaxID=1555241 RepID=A0A4P9X3L1_9FUNG|nr:hypothetical protein CXG81DRAFT_20333 [Caulochytrium protostelioides]|eukprot:RKO99601.1 hypothetical protein CXG81DRAFT_20333 [Caulochytrium protostelioides]
MLISDQGEITHLTIALLGAAHVGKSTLAQCFVRNTTVGSVTGRSARPTSQTLYLGPYEPTIESSWSIHHAIPANVRSNYMGTAGAAVPLPGSIRGSAGLHAQHGSDSGHGGSGGKTDANGGMDLAFSCSTTPGGLVGTAGQAPASQPSHHDSGSYFSFKNSSSSSNNNNHSQQPPTSTTNASQAAVSAAGTANNVSTQGQRIVVTLIEAGGHPYYSSIWPSVIAAADAYLLVYDVGNPHSFDAIWSFYKLIVQTKRLSPRCIPMLMLGNMVDTVTMDKLRDATRLKRERKLSDQTGHGLASLLGIPFAETTSKAPSSVTHCFRTLMGLAQKRVWQITSEMHNHPTHPLGSAGSLPSSPNRDHPQEAAAAAVAAGDHGAAHGSGFAAHRLSPPSSRRPSNASEVSSVMTWTSTAVNSIFHSGRLSSTSTSSNASSGSAQTPAAALGTGLAPGSANPTISHAGGPVRLSELSTISHQTAADPAPHAGGGGGNGSSSSTHSTSSSGGNPASRGVRSRFSENSKVSFRGSVDRVRDAIDRMPSTSELNASGDAWSARAGPSSSSSPSTAAAAAAAALAGGLLPRPSLSPSPPRPPPPRPMHHLTVLEQRDRLFAAIDRALVQNPPGGLESAFRLVHRMFRPPAAGGAAALSDEEPDGTDPADTGAEAPAAERALPDLPPLSPLSGPAAAAAAVDDARPPLAPMLKRDSAPGLPPAAPAPVPALVCATSTPPPMLVTTAGLRAPTAGGGGGGGGGAPTLGPASRGPASASSPGGSAMHTRLLDLLAELEAYQIDGLEEGGADGAGTGDASAHGGPAPAREPETLPRSLAVPMPGGGGNGMLDHRDAATAATHDRPSQAHDDHDARPAPSSSWSTSKPPGMSLGSMGMPLGGRGGPRLGGMVGTGPAASNSLMLVHTPAAGILNTPGSPGLDYMSFGASKPMQMDASHHAFNAALEGDLLDDEVMAASHQHVLTLSPSTPLDADDL